MTIEIDAQPTHAAVTELLAKAQLSRADIRNTMSC
jgi:hypothetical protein